MTYWYKAQDKLTLKIIPDPNLIHHLKKTVPAVKMSKSKTKIVANIETTLHPSESNKKINVTSDNSSNKGKTSHDS